MVTANPTAGGHVHGEAAISQPIGRPMIALTNRPPMNPPPASPSEHQCEQDRADNRAAEQRHGDRPIEWECELRERRLLAAL